MFMQVVQCVGAITYFVGKKRLAACGSCGALYYYIGIRLVPWYNSNDTYYIVTI